MVMRLLRAIQRRIKARFEPRIIKIKEPVYVPVLQSELLKGRRALITGGTSGIGLAMAKAFIQAGADVVITGRTQARIDAALAMLSTRPAQGVVLDSRETDTFASCLDEIAAQFGLPDILVNNAGVISTTVFGGTERANYDEIMETNLRGSYFLSQELSTRWIAHHIKGNILNVGSSSSLRPGNSPYVLSKWGMRSLTIGLAKELIKHGITVNGIAPGPTSTKLFVGTGEKGINWDRSPAERLVTEEEVANLAVVLVSDLGRMVVGDLLFVTGGCGTVTVDDV